ncbi:hypothetical protein CONLIGDRAFT_73500 [Coniochaeta ligniaria NRRL 30616]|uniref:WW-domain-binding protein n=1 Tax=Coniochaeta ligniaria NRRL 30616 TaxID=1408157 RepID=A0A1J7JBC1_9PEZI|nr:hypothetical protein CONLIGDRAFT_73500 [Coniochaeta ligniaria NRRL 30616]
MADQFLAEQHAWTLRQAQAQAEDTESDSSDEADSWVMLGQDGNIVPLQNERILHTSRPRVGLEMSVPRELQNAEPFSIRSDSGTAYITNRRVIYLPARPTEELKSFFAPILNFEDTHVHSSWIGPWSWTGIVKPVTGGGIPADLPRIEVKLIFKEGGHSDFQSKFELLKERLQHARDLERETGQSLIVTDEELPPYEPASGSSNPPQQPSGTDTGPGAASQGNPPRQGQPPQPGPDEPPPDYIEAQSQAIGMQFEERIREEAERQ